MVLCTVELGSEDLAVQPWCVAGVRLMGWDLDFLREGFDYVLFLCGWTAACVSKISPIIRRLREMHAHAS